MNQPQGSSTPSGRRIVLLGPQRLAPKVGFVARRLGIEGRAALVTAGWQERELETDDLVAALGLPHINLELYRRWDDVAHADPWLFAAHRARQDQLRALEELYDLRLGHTLSAARDLLAASAPPQMLVTEQRAATEAVRALDRHHLQQVAEIHDRFNRDVQPEQRPALIAHRREIADIVDGCSLFAFAGGHVGVLLNRLKLFDIQSMIGERHLLAWSAGAMACCEQIALFHDSPPQGAGNTEIYEHGLGLVRGVVALPHARRRLRTGDLNRMQLMARRLWPARALLLDERSWAAFDVDSTVVDGEGVRHLAQDGTLKPLTIDSRVHADAALQADIPHLSDIALEAAEAFSSETHP